MLSGCWDACVASELHNLILVASSDYELKPCLILLKPSCLFLSNTTTTETIHIKCRISFIYLGRRESTKYSYSHRKKRKKVCEIFIFLPCSLVPLLLASFLYAWQSEALNWRLYVFSFTSSFVFSTFYILSISHAALVNIICGIFNFLFLSLFIFRNPIVEKLETRDECSRKDRNNFHNFSLPHFANENIKTCEDKKFQVSELIKKK